MKEIARKRYLLAVLLVLLAFNYMERHAFGLMLQQIKLDLLLSDTQLGLLTGIAFALFYAFMGIPIARWADRGNRVVIMAIAAALSGAAVAACGLAVSFLQLLLIRIAVAVGEAGCVPPAHSLIAETFDRAQRPRAVAIYKLGVPLSSLLGFFLSGWLNEVYGWRVTLMLLGFPGLILGTLTWLTLQDPRRHEPSHGAGSSGTSASANCRGGCTALATQPKLRDVWATLWTNTAFRNVLLAYSIGSFFSMGISQWSAVVFIRSYGLETGELGTAFALIWGVGGMLGIFLGGYLATRYAPRNEGLQLKCMAVAYCGFGIISAGVYLSPNHHLAFALLALSVFGVSGANGPLFATIQTLVPERMRALSIAVIFLCSNLIGMGLGPVAAGVLSDAFKPWAGEDSLRYALLSLCPGFIWCSWYLWRASRTVARDIPADAS